MCPNCKKEYDPSQKDLEELAAQYGEEAFQTVHMGKTAESVFYRRSACDVCSSTGYKGRMGIHELLEGTKAIKKMIKKEAPTDEIFSQGVKEGMTTLKQDGIDKICLGLTDIKEVRRVCID